VGRRRFATDHQDLRIRALERIRERLGLSQKGMADALVVPPRTYQKWVAGVQRPRHAAALLARAEALIEARRPNCWEVRQCTRQPGGEGAALFGPCPAATHEAADGLNGGTNGGRICWAVEGTPCGLDLADAGVPKLISCLGCEFFRRVYAEEGLARFALLMPGQEYRER